MSRPLINQLRIYSVAILTDSGDVCNWTVGASLVDAKAEAKSRRKEFPDAGEFRVICSRDGIVFTC